MDPRLKSQNLVALLSLALAWVMTSCTSSAPPAPEGGSSGSTNKVNIDQSSGDEDEDDEDDEDEDEDDEDDESSDDEDDEDEEDEEETDPYAALVHQDKLEECHDEKKVYDRRTATDDDAGECHEAKWPASFPCTKAGVISAFNSTQTIKDYVAKQASDGFRIDQCGEYSNGNPIVFYTKKDGTDDEPELRVRVVEPE